jgi:hypothetical protein
MGGGQIILALDGSVEGLPEALVENVNLRCGNINVEYYCAVPVALKIASDD